MAPRIKIDIPKSISLLKTGKTQVEVAKSIGIDVVTLRRRLQESGFPLGRSQRCGKEGELQVGTILRNHGRKVKFMPYTCSFDLLVDGSTRVEVKTSKRRKFRGISVWRFNLHRHKILAEKYDCYILRLENVPDSKNAIHLLLKAPQNRKVIQVSIRSLMNGMGQHARDFYRFAHGERFVERN